MALEGNDCEIQKQLAFISAIPALPAILGLLREQTDMRFVGIARVTPDRWVTCAVLDEAGLGLKVGDELDVNTTLCKAQLANPHTIAFDDAQTDPTYCDHPAPKLYGFRSHVSAPICLADGRYFGSLCALDPAPKLVTNTRGVAMMEGMAALVGKMLDEVMSHGSTKQALVNEQAISLSREQFIAVVAHDLRGPLGAMQSAADMLSVGKDPVTKRTGDRLRRSAARMRGLIDDLVDFSRGRAGSAMPVNLRQHTDLGTALEEVINEARHSHSSREILSFIKIEQSVLCDLERIQQLLSNLLGNALAYGTEEKPIVVEAFEREAMINLSVSNWGGVIASEHLGQLFNAYWQAGGKMRDESMGLGLHICQLIANAHQGTLTVSSDHESGTKFLMRWPVDGSLPSAS